jgi:hypothetical protein
MYKTSANMMQTCLSSRQSSKEDEMKLEHTQAESHIGSAYITDGEYCLRHDRWALRLAFTGVSGMFLACFVAALSNSKGRAEEQLSVRHV